MRKAYVEQAGSRALWIHETGHIERITLDGFHVAPSGSWSVEAAVTRNNFGAVTRRWSLAEILSDPRGIPWKCKNGRQKTFLRCLDHGTTVEMVSPGYYVIPA